MKKIKRILIINKFLFANGGSETYIFQTGDQFRKMGCEVQYFGMEAPDRVVGNDLDLYTDAMDFHTGKLSKLLYPFKIIYSREAYRKLMCVLQHFQPDMVHVNNFNFQLTPSILYAVKNYKRQTKRQVAVIMTAHDSQLVCPNHLMTIPTSGKQCFDCRNGKYRNCVKNKCIHNSTLKSILAAAEGYLYRWKKTYDLFDFIICPSDYLRGCLDTDRILKKKTITLHNYIGISNREQYTVEEKGNYILFFGRYSEEKGISLLAEICKRLPDIPFVVAGDGPYREQLEELSNIENLGFLNGDELYRTIAKAKLVLFPSRCNENCPFSVMEAIYLGTPVMGSRLGGVPELISDSETGYLMADGDTQAWTDKISWLWNHQDILKTLSENCRGISFDTLPEYCEKLITFVEQRISNGAEK